MANLILRLSTGSAVTDQSSGANASLGGKMGIDVDAIITTANTALNALFDNISKSENYNGVVDYRCVYVHNDTANEGEIFANGGLYISGTPKANFSIGLGAKGSEAPVIPDENTAPSAVVFSSPSSTNPLQLVGDDVLNPGESVPLWIRREANNTAGAGTITDVVNFVIRGIE